MVIAGLSLGAITGTSLWWLTHQTVRPGRSTVPHPDKPGQVLMVSEPVPPIVNQMRNQIPVFIGVGGLVGLTIGNEHWLRVPVPQSVFLQSR